MRKINQTFITSIIAAVCTIVFTPHLYSQKISDPPNISVPAAKPDDIYLDNSMSSSIPGVDDEIFALTVYDDKLIAGKSLLSKVG